LKFVVGGVVYIVKFSHLKSHTSIAKKPNSFLLSLSWSH